MYPSLLFAVLTPFDKTGAIDEGAFADSLRFLAERGAKAVVTGGTTGEFSSLTMKERARLFHIARQTFSGTVLNNISSCSSREANECARASEGADGFLILPPYYYAAPGEDGLVRFFTEALHGLATPTMLYHFPKHTKIGFTPALVARLREALPQIVALKDSSGVFEDSLAFHRTDPSLHVFVGKDSAALDTLAAGLAGTVSGAANPFPELLVAPTAAWKAGDKEKAARLIQPFLDWNAFRATLGANDIAVAKYALAARLPGFPLTVRAPLAELTEEQKAKIDASLPDLAL